MSDPTIVHPKNENWIMMPKDSAEDHDLENQSIPFRNYLFITIDIVRDFVDDDPRSVFMRTYGGEEVEPLLQVPPRILECLKFCKHDESLVLTEPNNFNNNQTSSRKHRYNTQHVCCQSQYQYKQFKTNGLENLCVSSHGQECVLPMEYFDYRVIKTKNSILDDIIVFEEMSANSSTRNDDENNNSSQIGSFSSDVQSPLEKFKTLLENFNKQQESSFVVIMGVTSNSCVKSSSLALAQLGYRVIIPLDCVACRKSTQHSANQFLLHETKRTNSRITTVNSWRDLFNPDLALNFT
nr:unnamed protein product [Naegleria fowleri]